MKRCARCVRPCRREQATGRLLHADVFRDNALDVVLQNKLLPNIGSPGMVRQLAAAGYSGPVSIRVNPALATGT
jgi:diaminopimelate decarboxylase